MRISFCKTLEFSKFRTAVMFFRKLLHQYKSSSVIVLLGAVFTLSGCSVTTGVHERSAGSIKPVNLNIVRGQPLSIYFQKLSMLSQENVDIQAWKATGLFSTVTQTTVDQLPIDGYFLRVNCKRDDWENGADLVTVMLWWVSAFTFPQPEYEERSCELTMYENGIEIASDRAYMEYETWNNGWALLPYYFKRDSIYATHAQAEANIRVRKAMSALTKGEKQ